MIQFKLNEKLYDLNLKNLSIAVNESDLSTSDKEEIDHMFKRLRVQQMIEIMVILLFSASIIFVVIKGIFPSKYLIYSLLPLAVLSLFISRKNKNKTLRQKYPLIEELEMKYGLDFIIIEDN